MVVVYKFIVTCMTTPDSSPRPAGADRNLVVVDPATAAPSFEETLQLFWIKHSKTVIAVCAVILVGIVGKGAIEYYQVQREKGIAADYVAAKSDEQLKGFIASHADHQLAGVGLLRLADAAYSAGRYADALGSYDKAAAVLKTGALAGRASLGAAVSQILAGKVADGEAALRKLADDGAQLKPIRSEAAYHLATTLLDAGKTADVAKILEQCLSLDPTSAWAQRAMALRATLPASVVEAAVKPTVDGGVSFAPKS